ncbi:hypothetical protein [uncultured Mediterranean phage]|nr:hypothetical protein [uncultured Mediterranean phage]
MKIKVIGGGWYGCSIGLYLRELGHETTIYEKGEHLFCGASSNNQSRLHLGFHYPRCAKTREASIQGHKLFMDTFPKLSTPVPCNIYAIADTSLIDYQSYLSVLRESGSPFFEVDPASYNLINLEGAVQCPERLIHQDAARTFFEEALRDNVVLNTPAQRHDQSEWTIDCTFGAFGSEGIDVYEPCIMHLYDGPDHMAITVMDGPFASIYPWYTGGISLTAVNYTPIQRVETYENAVEVLDILTDDDIQQNRECMESVIKGYVPFFNDMWKWKGYVTSIRGVPPSRADSRQCIVRNEGRFIQVQPGKIDAIFSAARRVREIIDVQSE